MKHFLLAIGVLLFSFPQTTTAQLKYLNFNVSMNGGYSILDHNTDFQTTPIYNLYNSTTLFVPDLTWEQYKETTKLGETLGQPRLGFKGQLSYRDWPIIIEGEALSSSSAYTRAAYAVTAGLGKYFYFADSSIYFSFLGGYKYMIRDYGFGSQTLVNSIGNDFSEKKHLNILLLLTQLAGPAVTCLQCTFLLPRRWTGTIAGVLV